MTKHYIDAIKKVNYIKRFMSLFIPKNNDDLVDIDSLLTYIDLAHDIAMSMQRIKEAERSRPTELDVHFEESLKLLNKIGVKNNG